MRLARGFPVQDELVFEWPFQNAKHTGPARELRKVMVVAKRMIRLVLLFAVCVANEWIADHKYQPAPDSVVRGVPRGLVGRAGLSL